MNVLLTIKDTIHKRKIPGRVIVLWLIALCIILSMLIWRFNIGLRISVFFLFATIMLLATDIPKSLVLLILLSSIFRFYFFKIHTYRFSGPFFGPADLLVIILFLFMYNQRVSDQKRNDSLLPAFLILFLAVVLSLANAVSKDVSLIWIMLMMEGYIFYRAMLVYFTGDIDDLKTILLILLFCFVAIVLESLGTYVGKFQQMQIPESGIFGKRFTAVFQGTNSLGGILAVITPIIISIRFKNTSLRIAKYLLILISILLLIITYSRNSYLAFLIAMLVFIVLIIKYTLKPRHILLTSILVGLAMVVLVPIAIKRFSSVFYFMYDESSIARIILWRGAVNEFLLHPIIGMGVANFYHSPLSWKMAIAHNLYVNTLAEMGIVGFCGLMVLLYLIFSNLWQAYKCSKTPFLKQLGAGLIAAWVAFIFHNILDGIWTAPHHTVEIRFLWFQLGLTGIYYHFAKNYSGQVDS